MSQHPNNLFSTGCAAVAPLELTVSGPGWDGGERRLFEQPFVLIGRDARSCLRLEDDAVSRRHAYLQQIGERVFCMDLGSRSGTHWGGESRPAGWLRPNQGIQIGPFTLELANPAWTNGTSLDEGAQAGNPLQDRIDDQPHPPRFNIAVGNEVRTQFRMNRELVFVGTSPDCRVRLRDAGISRYHCSLLKTPEGIWVVDLLSATGTRLNGQPIRWARMNEGDLLRVGPYLLRLGYEDESAPAPSTLLPANRTEAPAQESEDTAKSGRIIDPAPALQAELDQLRERLRDTEMLQQQLVDREAECVRLREQADTVDKQTAELADLKARLEVAETMAGKLEEVGSERDHWRSQSQILQIQFESSLSEREDLRRQLEAMQQQLAEEREAVRAANVRLIEQSAILQQLQEAQGELARARDMTQALQVELDRTRGHLQDAETLRHQLSDARSKHDELSLRARELENAADLANRLQEQIRSADTEMQRLRNQLQDAETRTGELEVLKGRLESAEGNLEDVYNERDHWHSETHALRTQIASHLAEREELRRQFESTQHQLAQEREAVRAAHVQLDQARQHQQEAEELSHQLADARSKHDELVVRYRELEVTAGSSDRLADRLREADVETERLRQQIRVFEIGAAEAVELEERLEAAEADAHKLEEVRSERDHWQVEAQDLRNRIASDLVEREQFVRLTAELLAVRSERDRLLAEQQRSAQESAHTSDLERALTEATAVYERTLNEERAAWEAERQTLKSIIEQARMADQESAQAVIREVQARSAAEREELRLRLEGAEAQIVCERGLFQEQSEQLRRQIAALRAERDRLAARPAQAEPLPPASEPRSPDKAARPAQTNSAPQIAVQDRALALFCGIDLGNALEQSARGQGTNKPAEPGRPRVPPASEWSQGGQQAGLSSIAQGVEDAWMQAAAGRQGPATQADADKATNPPGSEQRQSEVVQDKQLHEVLHACLSQPRSEVQQGFWRKILNLVRRK